MQTLILQLSQPTCCHAAMLPAAFALLYLQSTPLLGPARQHALQLSALVLSKLLCLLLGCSAVFALLLLQYNTLRSSCTHTHTHSHMPLLQLSALVLSKLLCSLPHMRQQLRSGYLLGDTRHDAAAGGLAMNNKVGRCWAGQCQRCWAAAARRLNCT